jgi:hypothetical protein
VTYRVAAILGASPRAWRRPWAEPRKTLCKCVNIAWRRGRRDDLVAAIGEIIIKYNVRSNGKPVTAWG